MASSELIDDVLRGDRKAISKAITILEDGLHGSSRLYGRLYEEGGKAFVLGVAGPPGAGKSSLINCLIREFRSKREKVGVVAIDPTSPFTGGALLGDRVRMATHGLDEGVYIRSMASRGSMGGLSRNTRKAIAVLDAAKYGIILLETVGLGQTEAEIIKVAQATLVVLMPEIGDSVQAIKAGLMEIGDIFVINKADLEGADRVVLDISPFVKDRNGRKPPILKTIAKTCVGVHELADAIGECRDRVLANESESTAAYERAMIEVKEALRSKLEQAAEEEIGGWEDWGRLVAMVANRQLDPDSAAESIVRKMILGNGKKNGLQN